MFLSFQDTIDGYLKERDITPDGRYIDDNMPDSMYKPKIDSFKEYCIARIASLNVDWKIYIQEKISSDDVVESARLFIRTRQREIKKSGIKTYFGMINEYFKYLSKEGIPNSEIIAKFDLWENDNKAIKSQIDKLAIEFNLSDDKSNSNPLDNREALILLNRCNKVFIYAKNKIYENINLNISLNETAYRQLITCIILKLMLLLGISPKIISTIENTDYKNVKNTLKINKFNIYLPHDISLQLEIYSAIREYVMNHFSIKNDKENNQLFIWLDGTDGKPKPTNMPSHNNFYTNFLDTALGITSIKSVGKYAIIKLINDGIPIDLIQDLTGYQNDVTRVCKNLVYENSSNYRKQLEDKIRITDLYDKL